MYYGFHWPKCGESQIYLHEYMVYIISGIYTFWSVNTVVYTSVNPSVITSVETSVSFVTDKVVYDLP
jgi:hypothetical protein